MKKIFLETYGCQMNVSDSERVASTLSAGGYAITPTQSEADVILINTCSVREKAELKLYSKVGRIRKAFETKPIVGVMGCVAQLEGEMLFDKIEGLDLVIGTRAVGRITEALESVFEGKGKYSDLGERERDYNWDVTEQQRYSPYVAFVPIIEGCNKFCTYCIVPFSRGREVSLSASEIVRQVLELRRQGVKEVHLIGQNVNSYKPADDSGLEGFRGKTPFSKLLRAVAATGIERVKFNTSFPRDFHDDIVDAIDENGNLCNWVHLPVQSGSDRVLKAMKRLHTTDRYKAKIDKIKSSPREIALTTDIIVGFPGETREDFEQTVELFEYCKYDMAYIFKYSPRFGTPSFKMEDDVTEVEKSLRFNELEKVQKRLQSESLSRYNGRTVSVLAEKFSAKSPEDLSGHSTCHRVVNFKGSTEMLGNVVNVEISEMKSNSLYGVAV
ncbi:MAG: tRNA (N6-isopentenyl adenosine(37)-C2)-methylthiotransferase MiaB [Pyrinomonadaceae bacterium]